MPKKLKTDVLPVAGDTSKPITLAIRADPAPYLEVQHLAIIERLCDEPELKEALSRTQNPKLLNYLAALCNPAIRGNKRWTATSLARSYGITPGELEAVWKDSQMARALVEVVKLMPHIAKDLARDASSTLVCCPRCDGWKQITRKVKGEDQVIDCPNCEGEGKVRKPGDPDARKLVLETLGWAGKNQTLNNYGIIQNNQSAGMIDELDAIDATARSIAPPIDVESE